MQHVEGAPWQKIGTDLFEIQGRQYLVSIDYFSNFIEVDYLSTTTSSAVISILKKQFSRFGIPCIIVSDGGPQFSSQEFRNFAKTWRIDHVMSSPNHPQANGKAEAAVKIVKQIISKCLRDHTDQYEALLEQRNTPRQDTGLSPAEMLFGRSTRTLLPNLKLMFQHIRSDIKRKRRKRRETVKRSYDKRARDLSKLESGQSVFFKKKPNDEWQPGKIVDEDRKYRRYIVSKKPYTFTTDKYGRTHS
jgi:transposase InsO family protein